MRMLSKKRGALVLCICACLAFAGSPATAAKRGSIRFGFEDGLQSWEILQGGFGQLRTDRAEFHNTRKPYNKRGEFFLSTLEQPDGKPNDAYTGIVESPVFVLSEPGMDFLIGGGSHDTTYVALCSSDGAERLKAHGENSEVMKHVRWTAPDLVGQPVFLRIVDAHQGGWGHVTFDAFRALGRIDKKATQERRAQAGAQLFQRRVKRTLDEANLSGLRAAVEDLSRRFPEKYLEGARFLAEIAALEREFGSLQEDHGKRKPEDAASRLQALAARVAALRRAALIANPLVTGDPILFIARRQYKPDHHNTATLFQTGEINTGSFVGGSAVKAIDLSRDGEASTLLESEGGIARDPEMSFDGRRIIFSMRRSAEDDYHIYEMGADGTGLRQLTSEPAVSDIDPLYLPGGDVIFSSTREPKYCMCNRHIMCNLFRMAHDGANIHQIGKSTLFEGHGALLPDGRILYYRWEYVDRNFGDAQGLWTVNPDGANHAVYWGNNTWSPGALVDARPIPGTQRIICTLTSCHDRPWGALAIVDRRAGLDDKPAFVRTWPASAMGLVSPGGPGKKDQYGFDLFKQVNPKYEDPYPLDDAYFLCSRMTGDGEKMGIYLLDVFGNELLVHAEPGGMGCYDPMPLTGRDRPSPIPPRRDFKNAAGRFYVADVYEGTHMKGVERGAVKYLRVVESPEKRFWTHAYWGGQGVHCPAMNWHDFCNKRILGTVPVEADGSAYFEVPADKFVYFQLLDEQGMMVQSMRSGAMVQSGETTGCVGCHENRRIAPPFPGGRATYAGAAKMPLALQRPPSSLDGWYGEPRLFSFTKETQPVFDKHCVECHDYESEAGEKLNLSGDPTITFNTSYMGLWRTGHINPIGAGPHDIQEAYSWGSHASKLVKKVLAGHGGVKLSDEEFARLVTWIDLNAPYYPEYACAYPDNLTGRCPLDNAQIGRLKELTGVDFAGLARHSRGIGPQVSFERPEKSPCLAKLKAAGGPEYDEALGIIRAGKAMLAQRPRADMPGFTLAGADLEREKKYERRAAIEAHNRGAIRTGQHVYDPHIAP